MTGYRNEQRHVIAGAFVFLLLGVFAVLSTMLVLFGAQAYRATVDQTARHNGTRILQAFIRNAVRTDDATDSVAVEEIYGQPVLRIAEQFDGQTYFKYIYVYDGALRELFVSSEYAFEPGEGEEIWEAESFRAVLDGALLTVEITDVYGMPHSVTMALKCVS